jgi:Protein of unknown function (DUF3383)
MPNTNSIVNVNAYRQAVSVQSQDVGMINILSTEMNMIDRVRYYSDLSTIVPDAIGGIASMTYRMAQKIFAQSPRPQRIMISNWTAKKSVLIDAGAWTSGSITVILNGVPYTQAWGTDKASSITALNQQINNSTDFDSTQVAVSSSGAVIIDITRVTTGTMSIQVSSTAVGGVVVSVIQTVSLIDNNGTMTGGTLRATANGNPYSAAFSSSVSGTVTALGGAMLSDASILWAAYASNRMNIYAKAGAGIVVVPDSSSVVGTFVQYEGTRTFRTATESLDAIKNTNNNFYWLIDTAGSAPLSTITDAQKEIAAWSEVNKKIYCAPSVDATIVNSSLVSDTTSIAAYFQGQAYTHSYVFYSSTCQTSFPAAAQAGKFAPQRPGDWVAKFSTMIGVQADSLTDTQEQNAKDKNVMVYVTIGGYSFIEDGKVAVGEWLDTIVGIDWMSGLIQSGIITLKVNGKVPYDDRGISAEGEAVERALAQGLPNGNYRGLFTPIAQDMSGNYIGGYYVILPKASSISANDKNLRTLNNVQAIAFLSGAILFTQVNFYVTV